MNALLALLLLVTAQDTETQKRLRGYVEGLEAFGTRYVGADNHAQVADHVKGVFRGLGYTPESHGFDFPKSLRFRNDDWSRFNGKPLENVVVRIPGTNPRLAPIIFSAHYDSINWENKPNSRQNRNAPAPGADDAGSAMAVLFELAHRLRGQKFEREIRLVAFDAEEQGLAGSQEYVKKLLAAGEKVHANVNFDMVGYGDKLVLEVPRESEWLLREFERVHKARGSPFNVEFRVGPPRDRYMSRGALRGSDHSHFIRAGYDAMGGFEAPVDPDIWYRNYNPNYHWKTDTIDSLNFRLIEDVAGLTDETFRRIARPVAIQDRVRARARTELAGAGQFAAAYALKELLAGNPGGVKALAQTEFWTSLGVFTVAARAVEHLPLRGLARAAVPLAAGMAAVNVVFGQGTWSDVAIDTGAYLAAGLAVNLAADALVYPALFAAGPPGWIAAGAYSVGKLALTLYFGEKLGAWIRGLFDGSTSDVRRSASREGIKARVDGLGAGS